MTLNDGTTDYTFPILPGAMTLLRADKDCAAVKTYSSVAYFAWDASVIGKEIQLTWNAMPTDQFTQLDLFFVADKTMTFTYGDASYYVVMTSLDGAYMQGSSQWRLDVTMSLLILGEVA